jgi:inorganic triphosphatase YgiF
MTAAPVEIEAKYRASLRAFAILGERDSLGEWSVVDRREVALRDRYFDTPDAALARQRCTLRVRQNGEDAMAELTLKGPAAETPEGVFARTEITVAVPAGTLPTAWAGVPGTTPVIEALRLRGVTGIDEFVPVAVLKNPRRDLVVALGDSRVVVSLDEVSIEGEVYRQRFVEIEAESGGASAVRAVADIIVGISPMRPARTGKVTAARAWLARRRRQLPTTLHVPAKP